MSNRNHAPPSRRRAANSVISLTQFAHSKSKGTRRAIEKFRQKKKSKFNRNAGLLREYRKAMKSEGYDPGQGASRKRQLDEDNDNNLKSMKRSNYDEEEEDNNNNNSNNKPVEREEGQVKKKRKKFHKSDPFAKAKAMAKQSKVEEEQRREMRVKKIKENEKKVKQKKIKTRKLAKRTNRGQPIMKNVVGDLLEKIKKAS